MIPWLYLEFQLLIMTTNSRSRNSIVATETVTADRSLLR